MSVNSYRDLNVWQTSMSVAEAIYVLTKNFPTSESYGLAGQMRRAAVSIASNIAEGHGRETSKYYIQALRVSQGSLKELETQLLLSQRVDLATSEQVQPILEQCDGVGRMLRALIRAIQEKARNED